MSPSLPRNRDAIALLAFALTGVAAIGVGIARADLGSDPDPAGPVASAPASVEAASPSPVSTPTSTPGVVATAEPVVTDEPEPASWRVVDESVETPARAVVAEVAAIADETQPLRVVSVHDVDGRPEIVVRQVAGRAEAVDAVRDAQSQDDVLAVTLDTEVHTLGAPVRTALSGTDPRRPDQWALNRLAAEQTWDNATGQGAVVAVVDTGVDGTHPDLTGQLTAAGFDFVTDSGDGRVDLNKHGTHVAGIVAAVQGNSVGVAGLAPQAKVMPIRVLDANGSGYNSDVAQGVTYAADHGADVINLSLGGSYADPVLQSAVNYALGKGVIVVAAAGNERTEGNPVTYPAAFPGVVAVAATTDADASSWFSNTGSYVDVAAPGSSILSTVPGGGYVKLNGTSMATPYVAATAALAVDGTDGALTSAQFESALAKSAVDLGATGRDDYFGAGLVNPNAMLCTLITCSVVPDGDSTETPTGTPTAEPSDSPEALPSIEPSIEPSPTPTPTAPAPGGGGGGGGAAPAPDPTPTPTPTPPTPTLDPEPVEQPRTDPVPDRPAAQLSFVAGAGRARVGQRLPVQVQLETADGQVIVGQDVAVQAWREGQVVARRVATTEGDGVATAYFPITATTRFTARTLDSDEVAPTQADGAARWIATPRFRLGHTGRRASLRLVDNRGQRVLVQAKRGKHWVTVRRPRPDATGRVVVRGLRAGVYRVRITAAPGLASVNSRLWRAR
ncbi:MAG: S8 family serine peptidase [Actinomycetota bacterium]